MIIRSRALSRHRLLHPVTTEFTAERAGERLDVFVSRCLPQLTRSRIKRLIDEGFVAVAGERAKPGLRLASGQRVSVDIPPPAPARAEPEAIALHILFEDGDILAVNKPAGMTVHPAPGHESSTLVNAILAHCTDLSGIGGVLRPGIVHRLDRDTSGVILIAKNDAAHNALARQLKERTVEKTYLALVEGTPKPQDGTIDAPIARDPRRRERMSVIEGGRESVTTYRVMERFAGYSLVEAKPKTGRTHQIRVHLAAIGHPVAGDRVYGRRSTLLDRQFLHALRITFTHPSSSERMTIEAPLPRELEGVLESLRASAT
jgi:23S rRNA pseudouridine1911/1915/1917 synthase